MEARTKYYCDICGKEFDTSEECIAHENTHYVNWSEVDNGRIAKELRHISDFISDYRSGNTVLGYAYFDFKNLLDETAKRLEETEN